MTRDDMRSGDPAKVPELAWLRRVVTGLALVMGLGIVAVAGVLWLRLSQPPLPALPAAITLPEGSRPAAITFARDWTIVVTDTAEVLIFDRGGALRDRRQVE